MNKLLLTVCLCLCVLGVFSLDGKFKTRSYPQFTGLSTQELKTLFGGNSIKKRPDQPKPLDRNDVSTNGVDSFDSFEVSEEWPECKKVFEDIQVQGNCSSSWATSVATSIRDRRCIQSGHTDPLSTYDLLSCCEGCKLDGENGCNGGDHHAAFQYFLKQGIVTGGAYESDQGCKPYPIRPNTDSPKPGFTQCQPKCRSDYTKNSYASDKLFGKKQLSFSYANQHVMNELMENGPLVAEFELYEDFLNYSSGVYKHEHGQFLAYHYAKIIGWGKTPDGQLFWHATNSFGENWGENGTFRIARDHDESSFELNIHAAILKSEDSRKTTPKVKPTPPPSHDKLECSSITGYFAGSFQREGGGSSFDSQFQFRLSVNSAKTIVKMDNIKWNKTVANGQDYYFEFFKFDDGEKQCTPEINDCSLPVTAGAKKFFVNIFYSWQPDVIAYTDFNNVFTLKDTIGQCTQTIPLDWDSDNWKPDRSAYEACICCGDKYLPDSSLGCPISPWP